MKNKFKILTGFERCEIKNIIYSLLIFWVVFGLSGIVGACCDVGNGTCYTCGQTVYESCNLTANLTSNGNCFEIGADDITINGAGYSITGNTTGNGIYANGRNNVTIKDINIYNFADGIRFDNSNDNGIINNTANNNMEYGVRLVSSSNNTLISNTMENNNWAGIDIVFSSNNSLTDNTANDNGGDGIYLESSSSNNTLTNNTANNNSNQGIRLDDSSSNTLAFNTANSNGDDGIGLDESSNNTLTDNTACLNTNADIAIDSGSGNTGDNNTCDGAHNWNDTETEGCTSTCGEPSLPICGHAHTQGMISYWKADGDASDSYAGNDGTLQGAATFTAGQVGQAFSFDGVDDYVNTSNAFTDSSVTEFTIEAWMKIEGWENKGNGIYIGGTAFEAYWGAYLGTGTSGGNSIDFRVLIPKTPCGEVEVFYSDSNWHHLVGTFSSGELRLYKDGILVGNSSYSTPLDFSGYDTLIGYHWSLGGYFNGAIDEVAIYNRALTLTEIYQHYINGLNGEQYCNISCSCVGATHTFVCGQTVNESCNLNCNLISTGTCFTLGADNVIIDGNGFSITGNKSNETYGIYANGRNNVTIKNFKIYNFPSGIYLHDSSNSKISNSKIVKANGADYGGIDLWFSSNNIISNNNLTDLNCDGIRISSSVNNTISSNTVINSTYQGIKLVNSNGTNITNNKILNISGTGIALWDYSSNNNIINNTANSNQGYGGIYLNSASNNLMADNTANSNGLGIYLEGSSNNTLTNNTAISNGYGIVLESSISNNITDNDLTNNSISLLDFGYSGCNYVENNTGGNGKPIRYECGVSGINISNTDEYSEIFFRGVNNSLIDNVTVSNPGTRGDGIIFLSSNNNTIQNSNLSYVSGIHLHHSEGNTFIKNTLNSNGWGIYLGYSSSNNTITNNTISSNNNGIFLFDNSSFNNISNNNISNNNNAGITLSDFEDEWGEGNSNNTIEGNEISNNGVGIYFKNSPNNIITNNNVTSNNGEGIYLADNSNFNKILNNKILNNTKTGITISDCDPDENCFGENTNNTLQGNEISSSDIGIYLKNSSSNALIDNTANSNQIGISVESSNSNTVINNTANSNSYFGIFLEYSNSNTVINNTANSNNWVGIIIVGQSNNITGNNLTNNYWFSLLDYGLGCNYVENNIGGDGKPIRYEHDTSNITISDTDEYSGIFWCNVNNSLIDNVTISNPKTMSDGIFIVNSNNNTIRNSNLSYVWVGIALKGSDNTTVINNTITNSKSDGINLEYSKNNTITNNTVNSNTNGIFLVHHSNFNKILDNEISNNNNTGISITDCYPDECLEGNSNNTIQGNEISNNNIGIYSNASTSTINSNIVCDNTNSDFYSFNWLSSSGTNNTCDLSDGWSDYNTTGCKNSCMFELSNFTVGKITTQKTIYSPGEEFNFTIFLKSTIKPKSIEIVDFLPIGLEFISATPAPVFSQNKVILWKLNESSCVQENLWVCSTTLKVKVTSFASGTLENTANFEFEDVNGNNYSASTRTLVYVPPPSLKIQKTPGFQLHSPTENHAESKFTLTITSTRNHSDVTVIDILPDGANFINATPNPLQQGNKLIWNLGSMGDSEVKTINLTINFPGLFWTTQKNFVMVNGTDLLENISTDSNYSWIRISDYPDPIWMYKTPGVVNAEPGDYVTFTINAIVQANTSTTHAEIYDVLPDGLEFVSATGDYTYIEASNTLIWNETIFTLGGINTTFDYTVVAKIKDDAYGILKQKVTGWDYCGNEILNSSDESTIYVFYECDLNRDRLLFNDYNDLMTAYKCFLGIEKNCNTINYQDWTNMRNEYQCFVKNDT